MNNAMNNEINNHTNNDLNIKNYTAMNNEMQ